VTQQYLIGQLSVLLEELQPPPGGQLAESVRHLRHEVESSAIGMLPKLAHEAIDLTDVICWSAIERGDANGFSRSATIAAELSELVHSVEPRAR
jgi:hypothetical protein